MSLFNIFRRKKVDLLSRDEMLFTQVDFTEAFGDNLAIGKEDWITTIPITTALGVSHRKGLPPSDASDGEIYAIATGLSEIREQFPVVTDGVYCPVCHIANIDREKLRTPCPNCNRELLLFDWN